MSNYEGTLSTVTHAIHSKKAAPTQVPGRRAWVMLIVATIGFAVSFWAWALLSPLGPKFADVLHLSSLNQSLVVAVPVIVGSLGRIPAGALTDRFGGRIMFPIVCLVTIAPVLYLGLSGHSSLAGLLVGGFFLGIGGTSFAVGVPFVNAWFPPEKRGLAIGIFGMGMGGTAISALTTVKLVTAHGTATPFIITAIVLAVYSVIAYLVLRNPPGRPAPSGTMMGRLAETVKLKVTWQAAALYAVAFGGYVAFSVYLPTDLKTAYHLGQGDASNRMAGFVLLAVLMRPVGGWVADRIGPARVVAVTLAVAIAGAIIESFTPSLNPLGTIAFLIMAAALGAGSGAVFSLVAKLAPVSAVGSVTGVVGAAGGLGGFIPPLIMGYVYGQFHEYRIGLIALAVVAAAALVLTLTAVRAGLRALQRL